LRVNRFNGFFAGVAAAALAVPLTGAGAQAPVASVPVAGNSAADVAAFYRSFPSTRIWFKTGPNETAIDRLVAILERSPYDGLANGHALAASVQAARAQARTGDLAALAAADQALSVAWVQYVQVLKQPTPGMLYEVPYLAPRTSRADQILLTAAAAPSLATYLDNFANPNVIYTELRDTAYAAAGASGNAEPDARLIANLQRLRSIPNSGRFMVVDSGNQTLTMFENGKPVDRMKVVVGKAEYPTPMMASIMYYMVYNPYWNAPDHLARKIAQNYLSMGASYLNGRGYQVMSDWTTNAAVVATADVDWKGIAKGTVKARIRQKPSDDNSMGDLKFPFPNSEDIFLHDTPHKEYFARASRDLSNGCVRLEDARRLARWLLGTEPVAPNGDAEIQVQLPQGVPIYLTYVTAQVRDGKIAWLDDPYGLDKPAELQVASSLQR
jgi:murein L,D-transpeptidase YcbB/YkuD